MLALAEAKLREVAQNCRDVDEARAAKIVQSAKVEIAAPVRGGCHARRSKRHRLCSEDIDP